MELFIAIGVEKRPARKLVTYAQTVLQGHSIEHPDDLHITLHYIGQTEQVNEIAERLSEVAYPPFSLRYAGMDAFLREDADTNVLWHGVSDPEQHLLKLRDTISESLSDIPFGRPDCFTPHITLSYTALPFDITALKQTATPLTGERWEVREFQLWQVLPGTQKPAFRKITAYRLSEETDRRQARILCVNDFHGVLKENTIDLGAAKLVTAVKGYRKLHPETEVVFGGDNCFGEPVSDLYDGRPVLDVMRELNTKATVLGNHDLDSTVKAVETWPNYGKFTLLAANLIHRETGLQPSFVKPYEVLQVNGFRIAVIGLCTVEELPGPEHPKGWADFVLTDPAETAKKYTAFLRAQKKDGRLDAVVALTHLGLKEMAGGVLDGAGALETAQAVPELDGMFTAHFHRFLQLMIGQVPTAQGGSRGQGFSALKFTFDAQRTLLSVVPLTYDLSETHSAYEEDAEIDRLIGAYYRDAAPKMSEVIFTAAEEIHNRNMADFSLPITGTPLSRLAVDVMRQATGCPIAMVYAGRVGGAGFRKGPVTLYDFYKAYSFANILVTTEMTGAEIWENVNIGMRTLREDGASPLAVGGLIVTIDPTLPASRRVLRITLEDGTALQAEQTYPVVIEDYLASNPFGFRFPDGNALTYHNQNVRDLMLQYFRSVGTLYEEYPTNIILERKR